MFYKRQKVQDIIWAEKKSRDGETVLKLSILESVLMFLAALLFLFCVKRCLMLLFPAQKFPKHFIVYAVYAMLPFLAAVTFIRVGLVRFQKQLYLLLVVLYAAASVFYAWKNREMLWKYMVNLLEEYLGQVNTYYRLHLTAGGDLLVTDNRPGILFPGIVFFLVCFIISVLSSKKYLLTMPVILPVLALMAVGKTPDYFVFAFAFAGGVLLSFRGIYRLDGAFCEPSGGRKKRIIFSMAFMTLFLMILLAAGIPYVSAKNLKKTAKKVMSYAPEVKEFQLELENTVEAFFFSGFEKGADVVDNETPEYKGTEVLEITVKGRAPKKNQYFRGFYGTDYEHGKWMNDEAFFLKKCEKAGYDQKQISKFLAFPANSYFQRRNNEIESFPESVLEEREMTMTYKGLRGGYVYLPYMLAGIAGVEQPEFEQDTYLEKEMLQKKYSFLTWDPAEFEKTTLSASRHYAEIEAIYSSKSEKEREWREWYDQYVTEHYMTLPSEDIPEISRVADRFWSSSYTEVEDLDVMPEGEMEERGGIWKMMHYLQDYFKTFRYNLELNRISPDMDPMEYFLENSHEGYCVHFASAAVLMFRKLGIPARFASGYVVHPGNWRKKKDGGYYAKVLDSNAHAWAEVYFKGIGWFPLEFTPEGGGETAVTEEKGGKEEDITSEKQESGKEGKETEEEEASGLLETSEEVSSPEPTVMADTAENVPGSRKDVQKKSSAGSIRLLILLILFLLPVLVWLYQVISRRFFRKKRKHRSFRRFRKNQNRAEVCRMNRQVYKSLCRKRHILKRHFTDREYGHLLQKTYPEEDWDRFMCIVKKACFSRHEVTEEEVELCHSFAVYVREHRK